MLAAIRRGREPLASAENVVFENVADEVFHRYALRWKAGTLRVNRCYLRNQILPHFAERQIADIDRQDVQNWFASLRATPVAADRSMPVLSVIMGEAEAMGLRPEGSNPCRGIRRYRRKGRERFLSDDEIRRLSARLSAHAESRPLSVGAIRLLLLTGCRKGEILTLRWSVDWSILRFGNEEDQRWQGSATSRRRLSVCCGRRRSCMARACRWRTRSGTEHRHGGIAMLTPDDVHHNRTQSVLEQRGRTLQAAWTRHPERLRSRDPTTGSPSPSRLHQPTCDTHNRRNCSVNRNRYCLKVVDRFRGSSHMREDDRTSVSETRPDRQYRMPPCAIDSQIRGVGHDHGGRTHRTCPLNDFEPRSTWLKGATWETSATRLTALLQT